MSVLCGGDSAPLRSYYTVNSTKASKVSTEPMVVSGTIPNFFTPITPPPSARSSLDLVSTTSPEKTLVGHVKRLCALESHSAGDITILQVSAVMFREIKEFLSQRRIRYGYVFQSQCLILHFPSAAHEVATNYLSDHFGVAMRAQEVSCSEEIRWIKGAALTTELLDDHGNPDQTFVADMTIHNKHNDPVVFIEASFSPKRDAAITKIKGRFSNSPSLVGAILVNFEEDPDYKRPQRSPTSEDIILEDEWEGLVNPRQGPITVKGDTWCGKMTCCVNILMAGDIEPRAAQQIIPQSDASTGSLDAALSELWKHAVLAVGGPHTQPIDFAVSWGRFRKETELSFRNTALARYNTWINLKKRQRDPEYETGSAESSRTEEEEEVEAKVL
ncbi:hypothetical protein FIBSPDRAFT_1042841 [Athelia psychrophila]|uniref:Uncharacterized protein n=1 Tax=Athelia psychrophila TaxID=1759441 RepID=A0A166M6U0_9AGAM|nr:hypothetical protein FIBSPDRAFT_1042841 [Fibularhizoctonia sp. CBS 109695]